MMMSHCIHTIHAIERVQNIGKKQRAVIVIATKTIFRLEKKQLNIDIRPHVEAKLY